MSALSRVARIVRTYTVGRLGGAPSTAAFWYNAAPPRVIDAASLTAYRADADPYPLYLFDHRGKLSYPTVDADGVAFLNYDPPIGRQLNPEAAFQYLLGVADAVRTTRPELKDTFLRGATRLLDLQTPEGDWPYQFDWFESKAPWFSALAQSRGVSVMLRAGRLSGDDRFIESAHRAVSRFEVPLADGGYLHTFESTGIPYFEEYPLSPSAVMNGFLATVFGLWELTELTGAESARRKLNLALDSLEQMLPAYDCGWWTLYDRRGYPEHPNVQSVFYHRMVVDYMRVLVTLDDRPAFRDLRQRWEGYNTGPARLKATLAKLKFKVTHR